MESTPQRGVRVNNLRVGQDGFQNCLFGGSDVVGEDLVKLLLALAGWWLVGVAFWAHSLGLFLKAMVRSGF